MTNSNDYHRHDFVVFHLVPFICTCRGEDEERADNKEAKVLSRNVQLYAPFIGQRTQPCACFNGGSRAREYSLKIFCKLSLQIFFFISTSGAKNKTLHSTLWQEEQYIQMDREGGYLFCLHN